MLKKNIVKPDKKLLKTKVCTKCKVEKAIAQFRITRKGIMIPRCNSCTQEVRRKWRKENRAKQLETQSVYYKKNKIKILEQAKIRYQNNIDKIKEYNKQYNIANFEKLRDQKKEYIRNNKPSYDRRMREYVKKRRQSDVEYNIKYKLRCRVLNALKNNKGKKSLKTEQLLGCNVRFFRDYIKSKFIEGMSWELFMNGKIHIDHKIPCDYFDLNNEEDQKRCFHYSNMQPLWPIDNIKKGNKIGYILPIEYSLNNTIAKK